MSAEKAVNVFDSWESLVDQVLERQKLAEFIKAWQTYIREASGGDPDKPLLFVENNIDLEPPPAGFNYLGDLLPGPGVLFSSDPPIACDCTDCCANKKGCCSENYGVLFGYTAKRCLAIPKGSAILEGYKKCKCDDSCPNRVLQRGSQTPDGRGWAVWTNRRIPKGTFVMEYIGECNPNIVSCPNWVDNLILSMPRIAFFASRDVPVNEELTIDYNITSLGDS